MAETAASDFEDIMAVAGETPESPVPEAPPAEPPVEEPTEPIPAEPAIVEPGADLVALRGELSALKAARDEEQRLIQQRHDLQQRELAFLRAAIQPQQPPQPDPIQQVVQALNISEDDLATVLSGGPQAVATVSRGLQLAALLGAQLAQQNLTSAYRAEQAQRESVQQQASLAEQQRAQFWTENPELQPHEDVVKLVVAQVAAEQGERERTQQQLLTWGQVRQQVAERSKAVLGRFNAIPPVAPGATSAPSRRPVVGEMGGGRGRGGGRTAFDDQFGDLLQ